MSNSSNQGAETSKEEMDQWIKDHQDSLDYADCPDVNRNVEFDESGLPLEVQKAMAKRRAELEKEPGKTETHCP